MRWQIFVLKHKCERNIKVKTTVFYTTLILFFIVINFTYICLIGRRSNKRQSTRIDLPLNCFPIVHICIHRIIFSVRTLVTFYSYLAIEWCIHFLLKNNFLTVYIYPKTRPYSTIRITTVCKQKHNSFQTIQTLKIFKTSKMFWRP